MTYDAAEEHRKATGHLGTVLIGVPGDADVTSHLGQGYCGGPADPGI